MENVFFMKLQEIGINLYLNGIEGDQFTVSVDVPNNFNTWDIDKQMDYLENHMDRIEKEVKKI